jgi:hypothetical protein
VVLSSPPREHPRVNDRPDALFQEEWIPLSPLDEELFELSEARGVAAQRIEEFLGALGRQRVDANPACSTFSKSSGRRTPVGSWSAEAPAGRKTFDKVVESRLSLGVDPMEILEDDAERLPLALPED